MAANQPEGGYQAGQLPDEAARAWFGDLRLRAGETRTSTVIPLHGLGEASGAVVFKVAGTDAGGHHIAAWAVVSPGRR